MLLIVRFRFAVASAEQESSYERCLQFASNEQVSGGKGLADLSSCGNDDSFNSCGIMSFAITPADFGITPVDSTTDFDLVLEFDDRKL